MVTSTANASLLATKIGYSCHNVTTSCTAKIQKRECMTYAVSPWNTTSTETRAYLLKNKGAGGGGYNNQITTRTFG